MKAYAGWEKGSDGFVVAKDFIVSGDNIRDSDNNIVGVSFTQGGGDKCDGKNESSLKTNLYCDESVTGAATITSMSINGCEYTVNLKHAAGCPMLAIDIEKYMSWLEENEWVLGIMYLVIGPLLAFFGMQWFPYVTAILVAFFIFGICVSIGLAAGWMVSTGGLIAVLVVGAILGILVGILIKRKIWIMISLLGLAAGFWGGTLIFALIASATGWEAVWGWWVVSILMALVGAGLAFCMGKPVVLTATSFTGAYLFTRAWTLFFPGHWPSESQIMNDITNVETDGIFWVFLGLFIVTFIVSIVVQKKKDKVHEDLDAYERA